MAQHIPHPGQIDIRSQGDRSKRTKDDTPRHGGDVSDQIQLTGSSGLLVFECTQIKRDPTIRHSQNGIDQAKHRKKEAEENHPRMGVAGATPCWWKGPPFAEVTDEDGGSGGSGHTKSCNL